jgi:hypothetical protein
MVTGIMVASIPAAMVIPVICSSMPSLAMERVVIRPELIMDPVLQASKYASNSGAVECSGA